MDTFFTESAQLTECHNHTAVEFIDQNQTQWKVISIISALMNGLLLILLMGEIFFFKKNKIKMFTNISALPDRQETLL